MSRVFFTSDLHFDHRNLCRNLRHMTEHYSDQLIISNWNSTVSERDTVYILGDITMENDKSIVRYLSALNGHLRIIGGNHDVIKCCQKLKYIPDLVIMGCMKYKGFICTHIPVHESQLIGFKGNIHGHIHLPGEDYNPAQLDPSKYFNVNTEFHNYTPILFDDIIKHFESYEKI